MAVEVHDLDDRLTDITTMFMTRGMSFIDVTQEDLFKGTNIWNVTAGRSEDK